MENKLLTELYPEISQDQKQRINHRMLRLQSQGVQPKPQFVFKPLLAGILLVLALAVTSFAFIPGVRASFMHYLRNIAGVNLMVDNQYPGVDNPRIIQPQNLSLQQALDAFQADLVLPEQLPGGQVLNAGLVNYYPAGSGLEEGISGRWGTINFSVYRPMTENGATLVGTNQIAQIQLTDDIQAVQYQGGWNADTKTWDDSAILRYTIQWKQNGLDFHLCGANLDQLQAAAEYLAGLN